jgi:anaerobic dimethyl sulfoxide reductase subunit A
MVYLVNCNYLNQDANINKTVQAFKTLEFIVTQEQFMTPSAKYADIVLPTTTFLERNDLVAGGDPPYYGYMNKAIEPIGECKSHLEIAMELAKRLGVADYFNKSEEEWLKECFERSKLPVDYETFKKKGNFKVKLPKPYVAFREQIEDPTNNPFRTPSGKIEIYSERLAELNDSKLPPIPKYIETWENRNDPLIQRYPLQLITTHCRRRAHSQNETLPWLRELVPQELEINIADAEVRGIKTGDLVRAFNERGQVIMPARVSKRIISGVVNIPQGAWYNPDNHGADRGGNPNVLSKDEPSPCGAFVSNTALVQVERIEA